MSPSQIKKSPEFKRLKKEVKSLVKGIQIRFPYYYDIWIVATLSWEEDGFASVSNYGYFCNSGDKIAKHIACCMNDTYDELYDMIASKQEFKDFGKRISKCCDDVDKLGKRFGCEDNFWDDFFMEYCY